MPKDDRTLDGILNRIARGLSGAAPESRQASAPNPDPQIILDHIAEVSKNARATWFGMLSLLAFVGVTLLAHKDANFFAYGAETQLPLIGIKVPVKAFFIVAPLFVTALYAYLHLYLMTLYDGLADAPARIDDHPLADRVFPWMISHAALWYRNRRRDDGCAAPRVLGELVAAIGFLLGSAFGVAVLALLWWRSMPAHDEWLTLWIGLNFWFAAMVGMTGFLTARDRMAGVSRSLVVRARWGYRTFGGVALVAIVFLSWEATENGRIVPLYPANLVEAELTRKPPGWLPFEFWLKEFEPDYRKRERIVSDTDLTGDRAFIAEATRRYNAPLSPPDLKDADLRNANMRNAFLPGADLRSAKMQGADLSGAEMQGADLSGVEMQGADLSGAEMQGAVLRWAEMQGADLSGAEMQGADLSAAKMQGAVLSGAEMQGADLRLAKMQGAVLRWAEMQGADLRLAKMQGATFFEAKMQGANLSQANMQKANLSGAQMQGVNLNRAEMQGADLRRAEMQGAVLGNAKMQGADLAFANMYGAVLRGAQMQGADLGEAQMQGANFFGAMLQSADVREANFTGAVLASADLANVRNLIQARLEGAVGDGDTVLPRDADTGEQLYIWHCWESPPKTFEQTIVALPENLRDRYHNEWLCNGRPREKTGTPAPN